jgi:hypothetical protein
VHRFALATEDTPVDWTVPYPSIESIGVVGKWLTDHSVSLFDQRHPVMD